MPSHRGTGQSSAGSDIKSEAQIGADGANVCTRWRHAIRGAKRGWHRHFQVPTDTDLDALAAAAEELARQAPQWEAGDVFLTKTCQRGQDIASPPIRQSVGPTSLRRCSTWEGEEDPGLGVTDSAGVIAAEIEELDSFLATLEARPAYDSKLLALIDDLRSELRGTKPDGSERQAIVFTQFTDTMDALRAQLAWLWPGKIGCYSGRGGEVHVPGSTPDDPGDWGEDRQGRRQGAIQGQRAPDPTRDGRHV